MDGVARRIQYRARGTLNELKAEGEELLCMTVAAIKTLKSHP